MNWPAPDRWLRLAESLGVGGKPIAWYEKLTQAYAQPHRHYHNQQHIAECLAELDAARDLSENPAVVEVALWFHDAVYDPRATDNEEQSAAWAREFLESSGRADLGRTIADLVMATKSHNTNSGADGALMIDVDLSILGQNEARFAEYESQIRREYEWVPNDLFNSKRAEMLHRFLQRPRIYSTERFFTKYETQARRRLEMSVRKLMCC